MWWRRKEGQQCNATDEWCGGGAIKRSCVYQTHCTNKQTNKQSQSQSQSQSQHPHIFSQPMELLSSLAINNNKGCYHYVTLIHILNISSFTLKHLKWRRDFSSSTPFFSSFSFSFLFFFFSFFSFARSTIFSSAYCIILLKAVYPLLLWLLLRSRRSCTCSHRCSNSRSKRWWRWWQWVDGESLVFSRLSRVSLVQITISAIALIYLLYLFSLQPPLRHLTTYTLSYRQTFA